MAVSIFPHHGAVLVDGIEFDRHCGIGATRRAGSDGAAWAMMRPSTFLKLATPLPQPRESLNWITGEILKGTAICPAELRLRLPPTGMAAVSAHEGRHRMTALKKILDDAPVPVRMCVAGVAWDEMDDLLLGHMRRGMRAQRSGTSVEGPLFGEAEPDLGGMRTSGIPPPRIPDGILLTEEWIDSMFARAERNVPAARLTNDGAKGPGVHAGDVERLPRRGMRNPVLPRVAVGAISW